MTTRTNVDPTKIIKEDERQKIKNIDRKQKTFELHIEARRTPEKMVKAKPVGKEYLKSNHFITMLTQKSRNWRSKRSVQRPIPGSGLN